MRAGLADQAVMHVMPSARVAVCARHRLGGPQKALAAGLVVLASASGLSGCGVISAIRKVVQTVEANRALINKFSKGLRSGEKVAFEATYVTNGEPAMTVTYAVQPPEEVALRAVPDGAGAGNLGGTTGTYDMVANSTGGYSCSPDEVPALGTGWTCTKLASAEQVVKSGVVDIYTPAHWAAFLDVVAIAAGVAGDSVTSSTKVVNGFELNCIGLRAKGIAGTSTLCTTAQGILGYVQVAGTSTSFELKTYWTTPDASLFELPAGAKIVTPQTTT